MYECEDKSNVFLYVPVRMRNTRGETVAKFNAYRYNGIYREKHKT